MALSEEERKAKAAADMRKYYQANKERLLEAQRQRYRRDREKILERNRNWKEHNREEVKASYRKTYMDLRHQAIAELGGKCAQCGFDDIRGLCIDHVNGRGVKHRERENFNMYRYYGYILENVSTGEFQVLCANCNQIKEFELRASKQVD